MTQEAGKRGVFLNPQKAKKEPPRENFRDEEAREWVPRDEECFGIRYTGNCYYHEPLRVIERNGHRMKKVREATEKMNEGRDLGRTEASAVMEELFTGTVPDAEIEAFLVALDEKGERPEEL